MGKTHWVSTLVPTYRKLKTSQKDLDFSRDGSQNSTVLAAYLLNYTIYYRDLAKYYLFFKKGFELRTKLKYYISINLNILILKVDLSILY